MRRGYLGALLFPLVSLLASAPAVAAPPVPPVIDALQIRVAITEKFNVSLVNGNGGAKRFVTTRGTGYLGVWYPKYAWSPDGKYLLLVRNTTLPSHAVRSDLLLLSGTGAVLRTLARLPSAGDFEPAWARDSDQIAYVAWVRWPKGSNRPFNAVNAVDLQGRTRYLFGYWSTAEGCGGGTPDPAEGLFWQETGFGGVVHSMEWSTSRHIAVYTPGCAGGLQLADLRTGRSRPLGGNAASWNEAALSPAGKLAVAAHVCGQRGCGFNITIVNTVSGAVQTLGHGMLPTWSPDGRVLYFVQLIPSARHLQMRDQAGNSATFRPNSAAIWRADADGTHVLRLVTEDAYGLGPLNVSPDGRSLVYSRVDNDWALYAHRLAGNRYTTALLKLYGPKVKVVRFDSGHRPVVIAPNAGRPLVAPR